MLGIGQLTLQVISLFLPASSYELLLQLRIRNNEMEQPPFHSAVINLLVIMIFNCLQSIQGLIIVQPLLQNSLTMIDLLDLWLFSAYNGFQTEKVFLLFTFESSETIFDLKQRKSAILVVYCNSHCHWTEQSVANVQQWLHSEFENFTFLILIPKKMETYTL